MHQGHRSRTGYITHSEKGNAGLPGRRRTSCKRKPRTKSKRRGLRTAKATQTPRADQEQQQAHRQSSRICGTEGYGFHQLRSHKNWATRKPGLARFFSAEVTMTMTMTHSEKSHIRRMNAWPYRQECRGHDPTKKNLFY